ncbi:iron-containing alcohol dehydrogenase [Kribbella sp. CA-253562]|uniref:iron-containing alcohol dehydrogenase n=1 Tax=Kribbella sp. CA-253562 TaxID=3239942 RepID=UPI003D94CED2
MLKATSSAVRTFSVPAAESVVYGAGALDELVVDAAARRVAVVRSRFLAGSSIDRSMETLLGDRLVGTLDSVPQHVPLGPALELASRLRQLDVDCVVSIGGGTTIDCTKAVALFLAAGIRDRAEFANYVERRQRLREPVRHIAVPTTLSGAEHTSLIGITNEATGEKLILDDAALTPRSVVLDPTVTVGTPRELWMSSGIRAVDHAVEGMLSARATPFSDALGLEALRLLRSELPRTGGDDLDARLACMMGTWLAIFALPNAGVGLSHGIGHQLAAEYGILHGVTSAIMLPLVMEFGAAHSVRPLRRIAAALGADVSAYDDARAARAAADCVRSLVAEVGVPARLGELGVNRERLPSVAANVMRDPSIAASPRPVTLDDILELLNRAW